MSANPYSVTFGIQPPQEISRGIDIAKVTDEFNSELSLQHVYMITGLRGSGKTVLMTGITNRLAQDDKWITLELNPESDMLQSLIAKLTSQSTLAGIFRSAKINLSLFNIGLSVDGVVPIADPETAIEKMLESLNKKGKRVLVTVDEVANTQEIRRFTSAVQIFLRKGLPIYVLMTGLYENILGLQDEKKQTFLYRAPRIDLRPLNIGAIASNFEKVLGVSTDKARHMARLTKGYPIAFQALGYLSWEKTDSKDLIPEYRQILEETSYEKIWEGLSKKDRELANAIANVPGGKIQNIREYLGWDSNMFNPYRKRLMQRSLVNGDIRGYLTFTLPYFAEFVLDKMPEYDD